MVMSSDGRAVVRKVGTPKRIGHEAAMLRRVAGPGVVELAEASDDRRLEGDEAMLHTVFVGGGTAAERAPGSLDPVVAARAAAAVATAVAHLHDRGVAHRRLQPDHVLLADGRAVLCGLAEAVVITECVRSVVDDDALALAHLVAHLAAHTTGPTAAALDGVARRSLDSAPDARPSARSVAVALAALVPEEPAAAPLPRVVPPRSRERPRTEVRPHWLLAVAAPLAVALVAGAGALTLGGGRSGEVAGAVPPVPATIPVSSTTTSTTSPPPRGDRLWPRDPCPAVEPGSTVADVDGDGCDEFVEVAGGIVSASERRWQVAAPDEAVTLGDWDCDGTATPAVLRAGSGQLWVYPRWASLDDEVVATLAGVVPEATSLRTLVGADQDPTACDRIEVVHPDATTTVVTPP